LRKQAVSDEWGAMADRHDLSTRPPDHSSFTHLFADPVTDWGIAIATGVENTMKNEIQKEETKTPLSTASLAQVDDRREPENRASAPVRDPLPRREPNQALRDAERAPVDGGPTLVQPGTPRSGDSRDPNRTDGAANREAGAIATTPSEEQNTPLFSEHESKDLFSKWDALQVGFIDEPRRAVEQADHLVAAAMKRTAEVFAEERARLERQWDRGDNVSTEDLRVAMRRYRSFFRRLLAV
jgi:hypothetical protein